MKTNEQARDHIERARKAILVCAEIIDDSTPQDHEASMAVIKVMISALALDNAINTLLQTLDDSSVV